MKNIVGTILAVGLLAGGSYAQKPDIVVTSAPLTLSRWTATVAEQMDRGLRYPTPMTGEVVGSGIASVEFRCSNDGRPDAVTIRRSSGYRALDRAAMQAVSRIKTMHPMPAGLKKDQRYVANILFATTWDEHDRQIANLRKDAVRRNAWYRDPDVIAFNVGSQARRRAES